MGRLCSHVPPYSLISYSYIHSNGTTQGSTESDKTIWLCACVRACSVSYCENSNLIYISFLIPIVLKTLICDCLQTGPQRRRGLPRQMRGEWAEWKARRVPRMAPWRLSTLGTSARGTLPDRTPPPSRPYVGEIRIRALAIIGHLGDTYAAHGRSINTQRIAEMENCFYARSQEIFTWYCCVGRG